MTLADIRARIAALSCPGGSHCVVCARTGERPVPVDATWFDSRTDAGAAARLAAAYRRRLREYDPRLPHHDLIVAEAAARCRGDRCPAPSDRDDWTLSAPVVTAASDRYRPDERLVFCHRVAAALFRELAAQGHPAVERAVMDTYHDRAASVADPDDLCWCLLESLALAFDRTLDPSAQADVIAAAATRLGQADAGGRTVEATLDALAASGLVGEYTCAPRGHDPRRGTRTVEATVTDYALRPHADRLPVLPIVVELARRGESWQPTDIAVSRSTDGWCVTITLGRETAPAGVVLAPIAGSTSA